MALSMLKTEWFGNIRGDLLAGMVVALALIPEAIAFSIIAGVGPQSGALCIILYRGGDCVCGRAARNDLGCNRRDGAGNGFARARSWP